MSENYIDKALMNVKVSLRGLLLSPLISPPNICVDHIKQSLSDEGQCYKSETVGSIFYLSRRWGSTVAVLTKHTVAKVTRRPGCALSLHTHTHAHTHSLHNSLADIPGYLYDIRFHGEWEWDHALILQLIFLPLLLLPFICPHFRCVGERDRVQLS